MDEKRRIKWIRDIEEYATYRTLFTNYWRNIKNSKVIESHNCHNPHSFTQPISNVTELYKLCEKTKVLFDHILNMQMYRHNLNYFKCSSFDEWLQFIVKNEHEDNEDAYDISKLNYLILMPLKSKDRAFQKAINEYESQLNIDHVMDIVRASIVCNSEESVIYIVDMFMKQIQSEYDGTGVIVNIHESSEPIGQDVNSSCANTCPYSVVSSKNRFRFPNFTGYCDILLTFELIVPADDCKSGEASKVYCELQIHLLPLILYEATHPWNSIAHTYYSKYRDYFNKFPRYNEYSVGMTHTNSVVTNNFTSADSIDSIDGLVEDCSDDSLDEIEEEIEEESVVDVEPAKTASSSTDLSNQKHSNPNISNKSCGMALSSKTKMKGLNKSPTTSLKSSGCMNKKHKKTIRDIRTEYRLSAIKKIAQIPLSNVSLLEDLLEQFLTGVGKRSKNVDRLKCFRDLFQMKGEHINPT